MRNPIHDALQLFPRPRPYDLSLDGRHLGYVIPAGPGTYEALYGRDAFGVANAAMSVLDNPRRDVVQKRIAHKLRISFEDMSRLQAHYRVEGR